MQCKKYSLLFYSKITHLTHLHFEYDDTLAEKSGPCGSAFFLLICGVFDD